MSFLDLPSALLLTQRLMGLGLFIQSAELLVTRHSYAKGGVLEGASVAPWLVGRLGLAVLLVAAPFSPMSISAMVVNALLVGNSIWLTVRSRGPVCGGSDCMFFQVQLGLLIASLGLWIPILGTVGLGWIAAQSVLSYFLAGLSKAKTRGWWNGHAMRNLLACDGPYEVFAPARQLAGSRLNCIVLGGGVLLFEVSFPVVLILPMDGKLILLMIGIAFHLTNSLVLGLNRFVWAWIATYPAILFFGR